MSIHEDTSLIIGIFGIAFPPKVNIYPYTSYKPNNLMTHDETPMSGI